jgi:TetR/AcrR family transcriptional regulator
VPRGASDGGRREQIADALLALGGREGIAALTMERLAREVGVTSGALFRHFPSRRAMLDEAALRAVARLEATFPSREQPPLEKLRALVRARLDLAAAHPGIPQMVMSEQFVKALPPRGARAVRDVAVKTLHFIQAALAEAQERGEVRKDLAPRALAAIVFGTILATALLDPRRGRAASSAGAADAWRTLAGLLRPPAAMSAR